MKKITKIFVLFLLIATVSSSLAVEAKHHKRRHYHSSYHYQTPYVVNTDYRETETAFSECEEHYLLTRTTVSYYSDGTRRTSTSLAVYNTSGTLLIPSCNDVKHTIYDNEHYFLVRQGRKYHIVGSSGNLLTKRKYTKMQEISPNKLLVKVDGKFGIIDLHENKIVPIKYKSFEYASPDLYITKLNGLYGMIDSSNNVILKNRYDKIKRVYDTYVLKNDGKYGLADMYGDIILPADNDKIKKLGEYILVEKDNKFDVYDFDGNKISKKSYKKIRLERNVLEGKIGSIWEEIESL